MSLSRVKVWTTETLYASDLNAEFNNILNFLNASDIVAVDSLSVNNDDIIQRKAGEWATRSLAQYATDLRTTSPIVAVDALTLASGDFLEWSGSVWANKTPVQVAGALAASFQNYISRLTLSTAGSSATVSIAAGAATDSTNADMLVLGSALAKTTSAWAVGNTNGGLDTGSIANNTGYHVWLIKRVDTGVVDVLISLSASAPTMPTNYTLKRRIGWLRTNGSAQWLGFTQNGDEFEWSVLVADISAGTLSSTPTLTTLTIPTGVKVKALFRGKVDTANCFFLFSSPDDSQRIANTPTGNFTGSFNTAVASTGFDLAIITNTSAQIYASDNGAGATFYIYTRGWIDTRGKDA